MRPPGAYRPHQPADTGCGAMTGGRGRDRRGRGKEGRGGRDRGGGSGGDRRGEGQEGGGTGGGGAGTITPANTPTPKHIGRETGAHTYPRTRTSTPAHAPPNVQDERRGYAYPQARTCSRTRTPTPAHAHLPPHTHTHPRTHTHTHTSCYCYFVIPTEWFPHPDIRGSLGGGPSVEGAPTHFLLRKATCGEPARGKK